jgi:TonB family protein
MGMEQRGLPFSRILCPRSDPGGFTVQSHRASHLIAFVEPAYPATAQAHGIEGTVLVDVVVDRTGVVKDLSARTGHPLLAESALETIRQWRYRPTTINGVPVEVQTEIEVTFTMPDSVVSC